MDVANILKPEAVKCVSAISSKKRLFQELGDLATLAYGLKSSEVASALQERESLGPTGVGMGVALPHARLPSLEKVCGLFMQIERPLEFESVDKQPVDLVFALLAPEDAVSRRIISGSSARCSACSIRCLACNSCSSVMSAK